LENPFLQGEEIEEGNRSLNTVMSDTINQFNSYNVYRITLKCKQELQGTSCKMKISFSVYSLRFLVKIQKYKKKESWTVC